MPEAIIYKRTKKKIEAISSSAVDERYQYTWYSTSFVTAEYKKQNNMVNVHAYMLYMYVLFMHA